MPARDAAITRPHPAPPLSSAAPALRAKALELTRDPGAAALGPAVLAAPASIPVTTVHVDAPGFTTADDPAALPRIELLLRHRLGAEKMGRYLRGGRALGLSESGAITITVPSPLVAQIVERDFAPAIRLAAGEVLGRVGVALLIRIDPGSLKAAPTADPAPAPAAALLTPPAPPVTPAALPRPRRPLTTPLRYRFADLVVAPFNRLAFECARRHAESGAANLPGAGVSMLVLHGPTGLGKTHLLHALAAEALASAPSRAVVLTTAEQFVNEFVFACKGGSTDDFRKRHRRAELLCIDDAQALAGKVGTQAELAATIDAVIQRGGRIAVATSAAPRDIPDLSDSLVSRFSSGMVAALNPLDHDARLKVLTALAHRRGLVPDAEALALLAADTPAPAHPAVLGSAPKAPASVRDLEGLITRLVASHRLMPAFETSAHHAADGFIAGRVGVMAARAALGHAGSTPVPAPGPAQARAVQMAAIIERVCTTLDVVAAELASKGRHVRVVLARAVCTLLARRLTSMSYPEIARSLGRPNHSTVITAHRRLDRQIALNVQIDGVHEPLGVLCARLIAEMKR
ncbi:hypothetical protein BH11PLA1_BH11PLA1_08170 [soil metagenome]